MPSALPVDWRHLVDAFSARALPLDGDAALGCSTRPECRRLLARRSSGRGPMAEAEWSLAPGWMIDDIRSCSNQFSSLEHLPVSSRRSGLRPERAVHVDLGLGHRLSDSLLWTSQSSPAASATSSASPTPAPIRGRWTRFASGGECARRVGARHGAEARAPPIDRSLRLGWLRVRPRDVPRFGSRRDLSSESRPAARARRVGLVSMVRPPDRQRPVRAGSANGARISRCAPRGRTWTPSAIESGCRLTRASTCDSSDHSVPATDDG